MWFKNLRVFRLNKNFEHSPEELNELLAAHEFQPCGKLDPQRTGWVPPLGRHGEEFVHAANGYIMVALKKEEKILPAAVIKQHLEEKVLSISEEESRHVSRKERDTLKDEVIFELMPKAFSKANTNFAYIALREQLIVVNASSAKAAEDLITALREAVGSLSCIPLTPKMQPTQVMTDWLRNKTASNNLELAEECELQAPKDGRVIRCKNQDLTADEVLNHIESGMVVSKLALIWRETVQLVLDDQCAIKRLKFDDAIREKAETAHADTAAQEFDQEFAVMTTELAGLIKDIADALGGESDSVFDDE